MTRFLKNMSKNNSNQKRTYFKYGAILMLDTLKKTKKK